jgi:hypothetical protein
MSEYQGYELQALDRRLSAAEIAELRSCSMRARITPTSFVNDYQWGAFKGDVDAWMETYFDVPLLRQLRHPQAQAARSGKTARSKGRGSVLRRGLRPGLRAPAG